MQPHIRNIVIATPEGEWTHDHWEGAPRDLALFYAELLSMTIIREDWLVIARDEATFPRLAFGDGPTPDYRPVRWPDPDHPQQLHLDISVPNLEDAEALVLRLGATRLQDKDEFRSYADPVGHPFCLYAGANPSGSPRIERVVFDCLSPRALAGFYGELLDMRSRNHDSPNRVVIARHHDGIPDLAFQHAVFTAPRWPHSAYPQQLHLDFHFEDGRAGEEVAERLGAIRLPKGGSCPIFADPSGHPFCLCTSGQ